MGVVSIVGLLAPALDEGSGRGRRARPRGGSRVHACDEALSAVAQALRVYGREGDRVRSSVLVFAVLLVHSFPEGLAIGTAYASSTAGLGLFVIVAIALQNIPEGTSVAIPMDAAGFSRSQQFWAAVATSAPQPLAAVVAFALVEQVDGLLPVSFAFAAGAMLSLVAIEVLPAGAGAAATGVSGWPGSRPAPR